MKILFASAEVSPFAQSGGLGDVLGALPKAICSKQNNVSVIMPKYGIISLDQKEEMTFVGSLNFKLGWRETGAAIYKCLIDGVEYFFVENNYYFDRNQLYGEYDDGERFAFFSLAVLEFIRAYMPETELLHTNDWHTALCNVYLKTVYKNAIELSNLKTVFTIHNIEFQGVYDSYILGDVFGLDECYKSMLEYNGALNLMKGAIVCADAVTTVSERYAEELKYSYFGHGLSDIIIDNQYKLHGIVNGIDKEEFSPKNLYGIPYQYSKRNCMSGKLKNKELLYEEEGIEVGTDTPLAVMITRLTEQKGIDLLLCIIEELLSEDIFLYILGTGDEYYENALAQICKKYNNIRAKFKFDRKFSKVLYAAADLFIMPSKSEPCGLSQMIACSYGAVPIVHSVGGLADTIIPYANENSNGFSFENYNAHELLFTLKKALEIKKDKKKWRELVMRCMSADFSWSSSASKYISLYNKLIN